MTPAGRERNGWRTAGTAFWLVLAVGGLVGCGNLTSGGAGEVEVVVASDEVQAAPSVRTSAWRPSPESPAAQADGEIEGFLEIRLRVYLGRGDGDWLELTDGPQDLELPLGDGGPQEVARRQVPEGRYERARIRFEHVRAVVSRGLVVDGDTITGPVRVDLGGEGRVVVESPVDLTVRSQGVASLLLDLKAERWLRRLDIEACRAMDCRVRDQEFRDEVRIRSREP